MKPEFTGLSVVEDHARQGNLREVPTGVPVMGKSPLGNVNRGEPQTNRISSIVSGLS